MSFTTTTPASFHLPAGQVFAVRTRRNAGALVKVYGATSNPEYSVPQAQSKTFGPFGEVKTVVVAPLSGSVEYDYGLSSDVNLPAYTYTDAVIESVGAQGSTALPLDVSAAPPAITDPEALAAVLAAAGGGGGIVSITGNTTLTIADHNGKTLRCSGSQTLTVPEDLGTEFSCIVEMVAAATVSFDPTGSTAIQDSATPAGNTTTRTRTHSNNPSGVVLKSTATANTLSLSGV